VAGVTLTSREANEMKQTPRQIAEAVMAYSNLHENDALMATEPTGDMKWIGWEVPYYCMTVEEIEGDVVKAGFSTVAEAIKVMSKGFADYHKICADFDAAI
jgi:hypothetical protein